MAQSTVQQDQTILEALKASFPNSSVRSLNQWLKFGRISVENRVVKKTSVKVKKGQCITLANLVKPTVKRLNIIFEDSHIILVNKPGGLLSVASNDLKEKHLHGLIKEHCYPTRVFPVHRLDRDASGIILFAKTEKARVTLKEMFSKHTIDRIYIALVEGVLASKKGTWESYLHENSQFVVRSTHDEEIGKKAITHYEVLDERDEISCLRVRLETGRKNQIRAHCSENKTPILGDEKYGADTNSIGRLALHAKSLKLLHPVSKKLMTFDTDLPGGFNKFKLF